MKKKSYLILLIVAPVLLFKLSNAQMNVAPPKNPNSAKACAICHYRWIDTFFVEGRGTDLVDYTSEKVVATPEMCFSCHDGSIEDSRARAYQTAQHKTNVPPPDHMKIPDIFPLDEQGNMVCATCHTAHGVPSGPDSKETIFMRTSNRNSAMCRMCHPQMADSGKFHNHPLDTVKQKIPRRLIEEHALEGDKPNQLICETCHAAHGAKYESFLIESGRDSSLCLECHKDKNPLTPDGKKKPIHVVNVEPITATIPEAMIKQGAETGNKGELICLTCHKIHKNRTEQAALLTTKDQKAAFCLNCHPDKKPISETSHNLQKSGPQEKNLLGETVAQAGVCSACHLPHKAARRVSGTGNFTTELCLSCHSKGNIAAKASLTGAQHPLAVRPENKPGLPLFNALGLRDQNGVVTCTTCHDPHRWTEAAAGKAKENRASPQYFVRQPSPEICAECHRDKMYIVDSKHDLSKVAPQTTNIRNQTPLQSGVCGGCHLVHNAQPTFLWARKRTTENKSAVDGLCVDCHNDHGTASKKVIKDYSHPINLSPAKKGLATTLPLYDGNGKVSPDGLLACPTCHDPHRWTPSKAPDKNQIKSEGTSQNSFLRLENSPEARLCENCHTAQAYINKTDHDLVFAAPSAMNIIDQTPLQSGTCGVCHLVHNSPNKIRLWARKFTTGDSISAMMCLSCHSKSGAAENKIPRIASHPEGKLITNIGRNTKGQANYFPLFDKTTGQLVRVGNISCPSCHNAHQWSTINPSRGSGVKTGSSADSSFLRVQSRNLPCMDCHGPDGLFKYLYFHDPAKRRPKEEKQFPFSPQSGILQNFLETKNPKPKNQ
jgi:predicted CXXCH cytochrome family protein